MVFCHVLKVLCKVGMNEFHKQQLLNTSRRRVCFLFSSHPPFVLYKYLCQLLFARKLENKSLEYSQSLYLQEHSEGNVCSQQFIRLFSKASLSFMLLGCILAVKGVVQRYVLVVFLYPDWYLLFFHEISCFFCYQLWTLPLSSAVSL